MAREPVKPPIAEEKISCAVCTKMIPNKGANFEVEDYVLNFCGVKCYDIWKKNNKHKKRT